MYYGALKKTDIANGPGVRVSLFVSGCRHHCRDCFNPETGELMLGDIVLSLDKVEEQAANYGHSVTREYAFLIAHSMLHLMGYDHMEENDAKEMERRQAEILESLGIGRQI